LTIVFIIHLSALYRRGWWFKAKDIGLNGVVVIQPVFLLKI
jgi:hypothetical protein